MRFWKLAGEWIYPAILLIMIIALALLSWQMFDWIVNH